MASTEHYLPQFLLRGFATKRDGRHVYQFRRGGQPHLVSVRNVAGERNFYGTVGAVDVEGSLHSRESEYAPLVERLRQVDGPTAERDKQSIDALVLHLLARGRHIRDSAIDIAKSAIEASRQALADVQYRDQLLERLVRSALQNPRFIELSRGQPPELQQQAIALIRLQIRKGLESGTIGALGEKFIAELVGKFDLREMARTGQGDALLREPATRVPRAGLAHLVWSVRHRSTGQYILGDVGVLAQSSGVADLSIVFRAAGNLTALLMPISSSALLVGSSASGRPVDDETTNLASTELSRVFFLAAANRPREAAYFARLGTRAAAFDDSLTEGIVRRALEEK